MEQNWHVQSISVEVPPAALPGMHEAFRDRCARRLGEILSRHRAVTKSISEEIQALKCRRPYDRIVVEPVRTEPARPGVRRESGELLLAVPVPADPWALLAGGAGDAGVGEAVADLILEGAARIDDPVLIAAVRRGIEKARAAGFPADAGAPKLN